ncbi:MAG: recombinase family protein [Vampirovibrionales bacterium]|nr:recombinase family protein [Vampirovibrionales bacterium]
MPDQRRLNHEFVADLARHYPGYTGAIVADLQVIGSRSIVELSTAAETYPDAYGELLRLVRAGAVDAIVCRSRDRLGRTDALIVTLERFCLEHGVIVVPRQSLPVTLDIKALRDSEGAGLLGVIESHFAHSAVRRIVNEHERGMIERVAKHKQFPSHLPWGYKYHYSETGARTVVIDPPAAAVIRYILVDLFLDEDLGRVAITQRLQAERQPSPSGKLWDYGALRKVFRIPDRYAGYILVNRVSKNARPLTRVRGDHPAIITDAELTRIQTKIDALTTQHDPPFSILAGVVWCAVANQPMYTAHASHNPPITHFRCYYCEKRGEGRHNVSEKRLLTIARLAIQQLTTNADAREVARQMHAADAARIDAELDGVAAARERLLAKERRLLHTYVHLPETQLDWFDAQMATFQAERKRLDDAEQDLLAQRAAIESAEHSADNLAALHALGDRMFDEATPAQLQAWLSGCLRIYVRPGGKGRKDRSAIIERIEFV